MPNETTPEERLAIFGITLQCGPSLNKHRVTAVGNLLFVSALTPDVARPDFYIEGRGCGKVGDTVDTKAALQAARDTGIGILSAVRNTLGSLNRVKVLVHANVQVNCTADFTDHRTVMEGFSYLMDTVFGGNGMGALGASGANSLPGNMPVQVTDCIFEIENQ